MCFLRCLGNRGGHRDHRGGYDRDRRYGGGHDRGYDRRGNVLFSGVKVVKS